MSVKHLVASKYFRIGAAVVGLFLVSILSFAGGVTVGFRKAMFSTTFGEHYERNFLRGLGDREDGPMRMKKIDGKGMRNGHGIAGEILSLSGDSIVIKNKDNQENTVRINEGTLINRGRDTIAIGSLSVGDRVVVIGKPMEDGVIAAHLIRIFSEERLQERNQQ